MLENTTPDAMSSLSDSASIGTETIDTASTAPDQNANVTSVAETQPAEPSDPEALLKEISELSEEQPTDTNALKRLRQIAKLKEDSFKQMLESSRQPTPETPPASEQDQFAVELWNGLTGFDTERGVPTAHQFAEKLFTKDPTLAFQALGDLAMQTDANGVALGHRFLQEQGIDPSRLEDVRKFLKGEIKGEQYGIVDVPKTIPQEYAEAFKSLSKVNRDNIEFQLEDATPEERQAALETLNAQSKAIEYKKAEQNRAAEAEKAFHTKVQTTIETKVSETYESLLSNLEKSATFQNAKTSPDAKQDGAFKSSIISQITALGDVGINQTRAGAFFEKLGVKVNTEQVNSLMQAIEQNTQIAVIAEERGAVAHAQAAQARANDALQKAQALANRYFTEAVNAFGASQAKQADKKAEILNSNGSIPNFTNTQTATDNGNAQKISLEEMARNAARYNQTLNK